MIPLRRTWLACWLALCGAGSEACAPRIEVPADLRFWPQAGDDFAEGHRVALDVDLRVLDAATCPALELAVEVENQAAGRLQVLGSSNGPAIGAEPGDGRPLLDLPVGGNGEATAAPVLEWSPDRRVVAAGSLEAALRWRVFVRGELLALPLAEAYSRVRLEVPARFTVTLREGGRSQDLGAAIPAVLDLGELESGEQLQAWLEVEGNAGAVLLLEREYAELRHRERPNQAIPYQVQIGPSVLDDRLALPLMSAPGRVELPIAITVGEVERRIAGAYLDRWVLSVIVE